MRVAITAVVAGKHRPLTDLTDTNTKELATARRQLAVHSEDTLGLRCRSDSDSTPDLRRRLEADNTPGLSSSSTDSTPGPYRRPDWSGNMAAPTAACWHIHWRRGCIARSNTGADSDTRSHCWEIDRPPGYTHRCVSLQGRGFRKLQA